MCSNWNDEIERVEKRKLSLWLMMKKKLYVGFDVGLVESIEVELVQYRFYDLGKRRNWNGKMREEQIHRHRLEVQAKVIEKEFVWMKRRSIEAEVGMT